MAAVRPLHADKVKRVNVRHGAKFRAGWTIRFQDMAISKWRPPPSWITKITNFLTVEHVMSVELRHHAKFCGDRSNLCLDIAIFGFLKMAAAAIFNFKNFNRWNGQDG